MHPGIVKGGLDGSCSEMSLLPARALLRLAVREPLVMSVAARQGVGKIFLALTFVRGILLAKGGDDIGNHGRHRYFLLEVDRVSGAVGVGEFREGAAASQPAPLYTTADRIT